MMIYPQLVRGLTWNVMQTPEFDTLISEASNKYEFRLPQTVNPIWHFQLTYNYLKDIPTDLVNTFITTDFRVMMDFFLANQGQNASFLFYNPDDNQVGPAMLGGSPNTPLAQLSIVNDGVGNYYSPLQRTFAGNFYEDITDLNLNPTTEGVALAVYANGVLQVGTGLTPDYTLSSSPGLTLPTSAFMGMYLTWSRLSALNSPSFSRVAGGTLGPRTYYVRLTRSSTSGETAAGTEVSVNIGVADPTSAPTLGSVSGGTDAAQTLDVVVTYTNSFGETGVSATSNLSKLANFLLSVVSPPASGDATGWNVYVNINSTSLVKMNSSPIPIGTSYEEPSGGFPGGGAAPPGSSTAANGLLVINSPTTTGYSKDLGWNVYAAPLAGNETKQNSSTISYGTAWDEPSSGLTTSGALPPTTDTTAQPTGPITAQFGFYYRVRFETDSQDFEKFMNQLWCIGGDQSKNGAGVLKLITARPTPL
jgi:hypothetical protein